MHTCLELNCVKRTSHVISKYMGKKKKERGNIYRSQSAKDDIKVNRGHTNHSKERSRYSF